MRVALKSDIKKQYAKRVVYCSNLAQFVFKGFENNELTLNWDNPDICIGYDAYNKYDNTPLLYVMLAGQGLPPEIEPGDEYLLIKLVQDVIKEFKDKYSYPVKNKKIEFSENSSIEIDAQYLAIFITLCLIEIDA